MNINIIAKLLFISAITVLLLLKRDNKLVESFPLQTWSTREVLPVYWVFIFIYLIWLFINQNYGAGRLYIFASYLFTFLAGSILILAAKIIMGRRKILSPEVIGAKNFDLYWLAILIAIQYSILLICLYSKNSESGSISIFWMLGYFSITLIFWPIIETVFYLGMMLIPTSRMFGLIKGAILISSLQALSHFNYNSVEVVITFIIFGLLGSYLYIKSKRIIVPLLVHSLINFLVLMRDIKSF